MRIIDCIRPDKQTVMFSATFPRQMEALARKILIKPIEVRKKNVVYKRIKFQSILVLIPELVVTALLYIVFFHENC